MDVAVADDLIMRARVAAGWISQEDYEASRAPETLEDLDEEALAEAEALMAAEKLLGGIGEPAADGASDANADAKPE